MIKKLAFIIIMLIPLLTHAQIEKELLINSKLVEEYLDEFIIESSNRGVDIKYNLLSRLKYVLIMPKSYEINELGISNVEKQTILLSNDVTIDPLILKIILFRELFHTLGIPYNTSVIMDRVRTDNFTYATFNDKEILGIEFDRILESF